MPFILQAPQAAAVEWSSSDVTGESYTNQTSKSSKPPSWIAGRFHWKHAVKLPLDDEVDKDNSRGAAAIQKHCHAADSDDGFAQLSHIYQAQKLLYQNDEYFLASRALRP